MAVRYQGTCVGEHVAGSRVWLNDDEDDDRFLDLGPGIVSAIRKRMRWN